MEGFVEVGFTGMRKPDGTFGPSIPIYVRAEDVAPDAWDSLYDAFARMLKYPGNNND